MEEKNDWQTFWARNDAHAEKQLTDAAAKDSVSRDFYRAALFAKRSIQQDELTASVSEFGETRYSVKQGLKAACHTREDVVAIVAIQHSLLRRLQSLRVLGWACFIILCYIAIQVS